MIRSGGISQRVSILAALYIVVILCFHNHNNNNDCGTRYGCQQQQFWCYGYVVQAEKSSFHTATGSTSKTTTTHHHPFAFWNNRKKVGTISSTTTSIASSSSSQLEQEVVDTKTSTPSFAPTTVVSSSLAPTTEVPTGNTADDKNNNGIWGHVESAKPDVILGIAQKYRESTDARKVNLVIGAYRDKNGLPWILPSVRQAEEILLQQQIENPAITNKEYLPIEGDKDYIVKALQFAYGTDSIDMENIAAVQTLSGTGACRIAGHFLSKYYPYQDKSIYIPVPTWMNHYAIFQNCGIKTESYRYYDSTKNTLDFEGLIEDLTNAPDNSVILLHPCAHNPTGCDPTQDQWNGILDVVAKKQHFVVLDSAYQGFATGDAEQDAWTIRTFTKAFAEQRIPGVILAQSFAKNFGLYGERVGCVSVLTKSKQQATNIQSQLKSIIRPMYSSPPKHGSDIIKTVLSDPTLTQQYTEECRSMAQRITAMRNQLVDALTDVGSTKDWSYIRDTQIGMFAYTGLSPEQVDQLTTDHAVFLTRDGRISLAGLNPSNVQYVAQAIHAVTSSSSS